VALFRATTVCGLLPSESSPRSERALLSEPPAPLQLSTDAQRPAPETLLPPVSPTPTLSRSCLVPPGTMGSLSANRVLASWLPWISTAKRPHPADFTCFEAFFPLRVRSYSAQVAPNRAAVTLLGFFPSRAFALRASDPG
jgi:hypothetical protein